MDLGAPGVAAAVAVACERLAAPGQVVVVTGPGGWGKTAVLEGVAAAWSGADGDGAVGEAGAAGADTVVRLVGRRLEREDDGAALRAAGIEVGGGGGAPSTQDAQAALAGLVGEGLLLVDDAQWLDPPSLRAVVALVERRADSGTRLLVAHRPGRDELLAALVAAAGPDGVVGLAPLDEPAVAARLAEVVGAPDVGLVDQVLAASGGLPWVVDAVAQTWADAGLVQGGRLVAPGDGASAGGAGGEPPGGSPGEAPGGSPGEAAAGAGAPIGAPDPLLGAPPATATSARLATTSPGERAVLEALALGPALDDDLLAAVAGLDGAEVVEALAGLRAHGLLLDGHDEPPPAVAAAVAALTPEAERRRAHDRLARALLSRGGSPVPAAEHLVAAGSAGPEVAAALTAAASATVGEAPALAGTWFDRAVAAGAGGLAVVGRARAVALLGQLDVAARLADPLLSDADAAVRAAAASVLAPVAATSGRWARAADLATASGSTEGVAVAALARLAGREGPGPEVELTRPAPAPDEVALGLGEGARLAARGDRHGALEALLAAADLYERTPGPVLLAETPHGLGAMVALAAGDEATAALLLRRAMAAEAGGPLVRRHHGLLAAWVALRAGRWNEARAARAAAGPAGSGRDAVLAHALDAGLARRDGDVAALADAWTRAEVEVLGAEPDLVLLEVWLELAAAAARLEHGELARRQVEALAAVVEGLGSPALWAVPLEWGRVVVAVAAVEPEATAAAAERLAALSPVDPDLDGLAPAARVWADVLAGQVDLDALGAAVTGLEQAGRSWEASRLAGQAAVRVDDPDLARSLLGQARELKGTLPTTEVGSPDGEGQAPEGVLSDREREVARLVVDGLTHKEVGAQLYISPKTVEHHVAKIRQKLGATTRAEMMAALRTELG